MRETVHLVKFIGKGYFASAYVTLLSFAGYKVLKYSSRIHMVYLAAQQQNKLIKFPRGKLPREKSVTLKNSSFPR